MGALSHVKSNSLGDFTGTVTVFNSQGSTATAAATALVRPLDWNSAHNVYQTISGNQTGGDGSTASGTNIVFGGTNGMGLSLSTGANAATVWMGIPAESYYANMPYVLNSTTIQPRQSTSAVVPFVVPFYLSADFIRLMMSGGTSVASTTAATTGNTTWSAGMTATHVFHIFSRGTGANSMSLQTVTTTAITESFSQQWSANANSTQFSVTNRYTLPCSTGTTGFTKDWSSSAASLNFHSSQLTDLTGFKQVDFKFPVALERGNYWLMYGASTSANSNFTSIGLRNIVTYNAFGASQPNNSWGVLGSATQSSVQWQPGNGSYTTNATSTAAIARANVSSSASNNVLYFQFMRIA